MTTAAKRRLPDDAGDRLWSVVGAKLNPMFGLRFAGRMNVAAFLGRWGQGASIFGPSFRPGQPTRGGDDRRDGAA
jgi:hypothetical protein